jgi:hypothetical protein
MDGENYEIEDNDSAELKSIKNNLKLAISRVEPSCSFHLRVIEKMEFQIKVYHAVNNLFQQQCSNPRFHLVETDSTMFELSRTDFSELGSVPSIGLFRSIQTRAISVRFRPRRIYVSIPLNADRHHVELDFLLCKLHNYLNPTIIQMPEFRGIDDIIPLEIESHKRLVRFVQRNFIVSVGYNRVSNYIEVLFNDVVVDPLVQPVKHELLLEWASHNRPKSSK